MHPWAFLKARFIHFQYGFCESWVFQWTPSKSLNHAPFAQEAMKNHLILYKQKKRPLKRESLKRWGLGFTDFLDAQILPVCLLWCWKASNFKQNQCFTADPVIDFDFWIGSFHLIGLLKASRTVFVDLVRKKFGTRFSGHLNSRLARSVTQCDQTMPVSHYVRGKENWRVIQEQSE
jgi:hypothetical protein